MEGGRRSGVSDAGHRLAGGVVPLLRIHCRYLKALLTGLFLVACSGDDNEGYESWTPEQIYREAESQAESGEYADAAETFEEIERLYPYSEWARRGTIMAAYYYGRDENFEESRSAGRRFLASYPGDENAAYAQYLVAMSYYEQLDDRGRDQQNTEKAIEELQAVTTSYPDSDYANSAELKFDLAVNHLASKEMEVGRYYLKRGNYAAAIRRFQFVIDNYETTQQTPEALHRLVEAYLLLGLVDEAREMAVVLGYNFQGSEWYADTHRLFTSRGLDVPAIGRDDEGLVRKFYRRTIKGEWL